MKTERTQGSAPERAGENTPLDRAQALVQRVDSGTADPHDLQRVRAAIEAAPDLWRQVFDLLDVTQNKTIAVAVSGRLAQELLKRDVRALADGMGYQDASALERTLIDHTALCWLRMGTTDLRYAMALETKEGSLKQLDFWERRLTATQKRYLRACESLARIRRLGVLPATVQLNVGDRQVNIAGCVPAPAQRVPHGSLPSASDRGDGHGDTEGDAQTG